MTYGPQPGWNPNQPPAGGQPGYPPQPGYPQPTGPQAPGSQPVGPQPTGQPAAGSPVPAGYPTQAPGYAPAGYPPQQPGFAYGPTNPYSPQAAPRSPLPIVAGVIALLMFVSFAYSIISDVVGQITGSRSHAPNFNLTFVLDEYRIAVKLHLGLGVIDIVFGLVAILWLIGGILLLRRIPVGRTLAFIPAGLTLVIRIFTIATYSGRIYTEYIVPVLVIVVVVLLVLPATRNALRANTNRQPAGFAQPAYPQQQPAYPQQQAAYPPPQLGYPQQQPPGGYQQQPPQQQPPGGMPG